MQHIDTRSGSTLDLPYIHHQVQETQEAARLLYTSHPEPSSVGALYRALLHSLVEVALEMSKVPR